MKSEFDANQWLTQSLTAADPLEQTQRMPVADRRYRQAEARIQRVGYADLQPRHIREQIRQRRIDAHVDAEVRKLGWPESAIAEHRAANPPLYADFRDGPRAGLTVHERAQQDGFPGDEQ